MECPRAFPRARTATERPGDVPCTAFQAVPAEVMTSPSAISTVGKLCWRKEKDGVACALPVTLFMVSTSSGCRYTGTWYTARSLATPQKWSKCPCVSRMASGVSPWSLKKRCSCSMPSGEDMPGSTTVQAC